jgi:hypothetical protein
MPGGLYNTSFALRDERGHLEQDLEGRPGRDQQDVGRMGGALHRQVLGREPTPSREVQKAAGVQSLVADARFVADFKAKTGALEEAWVKEAEAKGLKNAAAVLQEFRAEIAKVK